MRLHSKYSCLIGTGGIGSGQFFAIHGNETLGREESREGHFLNRRDYCKLHIIAHYFKSLLGDPFPVFPIGKVGEDSIGLELLAEIQSAGLEVRYIERVAGKPTQFSFCFLYPDGSGGNLTTADSAAAFVSSADIQKAEELFQKHQGKGIVLAAPEVPLEARLTLLTLGTRHSFFRAASFTSQEMVALRESSVWSTLDHLAVNQDEAAAFLGEKLAEPSFENKVYQFVNHLREKNPGIQISVTAGKSGSYLWDGTSLDYQPIFKVPVESTAGAGDSHLAALLAGKAAGLSSQDSHQLAALTAGMSVTSPHTIHPGLNRPSLNQFAQELEISLSPSLAAFLALPI
jgi:ribokinase